VGLIISSFAHELHSLRSRLIPRTDFLSRELKKYITKDNLEGINKQDDPFYMLQLIKEEDLKLKHWLDYSLNTLKRDKRKRTNLNIGEYFERYKSVWGLALKQRKVKINLNGSKDVSNIIRAFEVDLDAIFNNLLSNSLTAFKQKNGNYQREVSIHWKSSDEFVEIVFEDNGSGLADEYKGEPNKIFEYNESSKRDRKGNKIGTGMGLYIVSLVIEDYNKADIEILPSDDGFKLKVLLPKRK
jgi:signal transduction histidine kinase